MLRPSGSILVRRWSNCSFLVKNTSRGRRLDDSRAIWGTRNDKSKTWWNAWSSGTVCRSYKGFIVLASIATADAELFTPARPASDWCAQPTSRSAGQWQRWLDAKVSKIFWVTQNWCKTDSIAKFIQITILNSETEIPRCQGTSKNKAVSMAANPVVEWMFNKKRLGMKPQDERWSASLRSPFESV